MKYPPIFETDNNFWRTGNNVFIGNNCTLREILKLHPAVPSLHAHYCWSALPDNFILH